MYYITNPQELEIAEHYLRLTSEEARKSSCIKSQRGAVIVKENKIIGRGYNKVTDESFCNPCVRKEIHDNSRVELCSAIHAEQMAIIDGINSKEYLEGSRMYHAQLKRGKIVRRGEPSCSVCSKMLYEAKIEIVLPQKKDFIVYSPEEFNKLSLDYVLNRERR